VNDIAQKFALVTQLHNFTRTKAADNQHIQPKTFQGHVSAILANDMLEFTLDAIGPYTLPKLQIPQAFSSYHREPTQVGDKGYAVPSDFSIGGTDGVSTGTSNMYPRGNLATHVFHPISNKNFDPRDPNQFLVTGGPSGHKTQSKDKSTFKLIDQINNIVHYASAAISHTSIGNMVHIAGDILSHNAETINQIAKGDITHAAAGVINHVASSIVMGAPSTTVVQQYADPTQQDLQLPPLPPIPSIPTILRVIGSMQATVGISAPSISIGMPGSEQPAMTQPVPPNLIYSPRDVTGGRNNNIALENLLQALQVLGLITDSTTPT
jgi:hypothetical protein